MQQIQKLIAFGFASRAGLLGLGYIALLPLTACVTHKFEAPDEPIRIELNVKIDQEVRVRLDREVEELIADNPDLF